MKANPFLIAAAVALSSASFPALANDGVASRYQQWEQKLRTRVNALHVYPSEARPGAMGDVLVSFRIGNDGKPGDITIRRSSGEAAFDAAAVRLVAGLGRLGPVPAEGNVKEVNLKLSYGEPARVAETKSLAKADGEERAANERRNRLIVSRAERLAERR